MTDNATLIPTLLITGPVGVGKTTVAFEVSELLEQQNVPHALIDLDSLSWSYPPPPDDRFRNRLALRNLAAVWPNYSAAGAKRLVLARVIESRAELDPLNEAVPGAEIQVVRLRASPSVLQARVRNRELGSGRDWHMRRAVQLAENMDREAVEDYVIETDGQSVAEVAARLLEVAGWRDRQRDVAADRSARYDGLADWYDAHSGEFADAAGRQLLELLGPGPGRCLDLACGTGINLRRLAGAAWSVIGVDISADQLRVARQRVADEIELVQADATQLPFDEEAFDAVACSLLHTDVDDVGAVWREAARVLKPGGRLAYVGIHPCFVGPFATNPRGEPPRLEPGYRSTEWTTNGPEDGIRRRVGGRHVPLAAFLNAFLDAGLRLMRVVEPDDEDYPVRIGVLAER